MANSDAVRIADLDLFADCSKSELRKIASLTTYLHVPRDRVLMREGGTAGEFIIIGRGTARVSRQTEDGMAKVADVGSGEFLGEMALLTGNPRSATATATTDLAVFVSTVSEFRSILDIAPSVADKVLETSRARAASLDMAA
ncbi:MAG: cyclic nucleotide-binding domain-containing protein [Acidimicrobiales bacterium]